MVHKLGYLLRRVDPNVIKFDATNRQIYLRCVSNFGTNKMPWFSDLSSVRLDPVKSKLNTPVKWAGASIYAPMQHHSGSAEAAPSKR